MNQTDNVLELRGLSKDYSSVRAVNDVSFDIRRNSVHCLVGENGAGKSTLIKILTGAVARSGGRILLHGREYAPRSPREAKQKGISTLFQELNVVDQLTVAENLTLGMEDTSFGFLRKTDRVQRMVSVMNSLEPTITPRQLVSTLSVAQKQIVEIAKAVAAESGILIMDEPTAAISEGEVKRLFTIIRRLRDQNVTVIYISHRLDEIFELGDAVTVMRDGRHIATKPMSEVKDRGAHPHDDRKDGLRRLPAARGPLARRGAPGQGLSNRKLREVSFDVHRGEIVGFYGLVGAGKTELARALYGADPYRGEVVFQGARLPTRPDEVIEAGIALVPEERRSQGLFTILTIRGNVPVMNMRRISRRGFIRAAEERRVTLEAVDRLRIATKSTEKEVVKLSGGNQQKVVFAKCLFADASLLLLDEPTRGIDVGAKSEIYAIVRRLAEEGKSILVFSSELPEILSLCDTIHLLYDGQLRGRLENGHGVDSQEVMQVVTGGR